ncbi:hypothetical protein P9116_05780, partial [Gallibacterium anatis]
VWLYLVIKNLHLCLLDNKSNFWGADQLEGLFKELKQKLSIHNGLTKKHKIMFIKDFLNKKSW